MPDDQLLAFSMFKIIRQFPCHSGMHQNLSPAHHLFEWSQFLETEWSQFLEIQRVALPKFWKDPALRTSSEKAGDAAW